MRAALIDLEHHSVTDGQFLRFFTLLFEPAAQRRFVRLTRLSANVPESSRSLQHDAFLTRQLLPSWRIPSHHGSDSGRLALMSSSSFVFTSLRRSAPTIFRASSSVAAKARNSVSKWPLATGSP